MRAGPAGSLHPICGAPARGPPPAAPSAVGRAPRRDPGDYLVRTSTNVEVAGGAAPPDVTENDAAELAPTPKRR